MFARRSHKHPMGATSDSVQVMCGSHVEFVFHYRITEFMRLIVNNLDLMEAESLDGVVDWMMKKISGRVCPSNARFSFDEEDEVEIGTITPSFLYDLVSTCQKRQVDRVDFEVEGEPRTVCWKCHCYGEEEFSRSRTESEYLDAPLEGEFEGFIDFLNKLEQRQEMIKESALRLLSPAHVIADDKRIEKSVQTAPICLPAEVFVPELPPPDVSEYHDAQLDIGNVENFVDALFDFDMKTEQPKSTEIVKRISSPQFVPPREFDWKYRGLVDSWEQSMKMITTPWYTKKAQYKPLSCQEKPSCFEDLLALQETAMIAHRVEKRWNRTHGDFSLSMTAALSTGVAGFNEEVQTAVDEEKVEKKKENEEWISTLLKLLEQKPSKGRKLLKGLLNYSKEHKSSKSSKQRFCEGCRRHSASHTVAAKVEEHGESANGPHCASEMDIPKINNVYEYMKLKLKENELANRKEKRTSVAETPSRKLKKDANQHDIRAYMVGKKVADPSFKNSSAQTDIRVSCTGKKAMKVIAETEDVEAPVTLIEKEKMRLFKCKISSKQRLAGKYLKLTRTPLVAVAGESSTKFIGRLSENTAIYGKVFKVVNLSRKEVQISVSPADWPLTFGLMYPDAVVTVGAGQTAEIPVTVKHQLESCASEFLPLRLLHRNIPISHTLSIRVDVLGKHFRGPLLSDPYGPSDVLLITKLRKPSKEPRVWKQDIENTAAVSNSEETIHTVVNMLKSEVECLCSVLLTDANTQEKAFISQLQAVHIQDSLNESENAMELQVVECNKLTDSTHTAIEALTSSAYNTGVDFTDSTCTAIEALGDSVHTAIEELTDGAHIAAEGLVDSVHTANDPLFDSVHTAVESECDTGNYDNWGYACVKEEDTAFLGFEFVDIDEGASMSSDQDDYTDV